MKQWIKLYTEILSDPKMGRMSDKLFRRTIELFLLAGKEDAGGILPEVSDIAWTLHISVREVNSILKELTDLNVIKKESEKYIISHFSDRQVSDSSRSEINRRYYEKSKLNKSEVQTDTKNNSDSKKSKNTSEIQTEINLNSDFSESENKTVEEELRIKNKEKELINTVTNVTDARTVSKPKKSAYGSLKNVMLTDEEYLKLKEKFADADEKIEAMSLYFGSHGNSGKYKSHYATALNWARMAQERDALKPVQKSVNSYPDIYSQLKAEGIV